MFKTPTPDQQLARALLVRAKHKKIKIMARLT